MAGWAGVQEGVLAERCRKGYTTILQLLLYVAHVLCPDGFRLDSQQRVAPLAGRVKTGRAILEVRPCDLVARAGVNVQIHCSATAEVFADFCETSTVEEKACSDNCTQ